MAGEQREVAHIFRHPLKTEELSLDQIWALITIYEFYSHGITNLFISPGLRNFPLIWAATMIKGINIISGIDERALSFMALGHAKVAQLPGVLISTSGSAAANYLPAVIEAKEDRIPLIILTASRPDNQILANANQAVRQQDLFVGQTTASFDLGLPNSRLELSTLRSSISHLIEKSMLPTAGVVHINCPFGDPIGNSLPANSGPELWDLLTEDRGPQVTTVPVKRELTADRYQQLAQQLQHSLVVVGRLPANRDYPALAQLLGKIDALHLVDIASSLPFSDTLGLPSLEHPQVREYLMAHPPQRIIHFGGAITAKGYYQLLGELSRNGCQLITINDNFELEDPAHQRCERVIAPPEEVALKLLEICSPPPEQQLCPTPIFKQRVTELLTSDSTPFNSYQAVNCLLPLLPTPGKLCLGNSMAIRIFDRLAFLAPRKEQLKVVTQRGASGIEGGIAAACGVAAAGEEITTAILGDISALYDLNSLQLLSETSSPVVLLILNNQQGGIFSALNVPNFQQVKKVMTTPHTLSFNHAAKMFHLNYHLIDSIDQLKQYYLYGIKRKESTILELKVSCEVDNQVAGQIRNCNLD
ncbi:MAG: 2-succinyl-5-enolpyruvyl-6-hydroxy-3-cyclohexene-1-carboxylic-acid synthase [Bdellovibrionales bacterium]|nr:2-succinyl-5-enolpyruvyl-6-hydroxy-3-cyclohexene-1-carboxylic-acid synthase [Bdellovibrionales bacterium]MBT3525406.1 2-succinyl-5-enolpyruvyl-6-hydroxy-3-cyclohexene-1-carboxylic-acid synthase [Bdellovibrionales bacterium]